VLAVLRGKCEYSPPVLACFWPPNRPLPSLFSVFAEVAIRPPRIHAGFEAVVCAEHRMAGGENEFFGAWPPSAFYDTRMRHRLIAYALSSFA